MLWTHWLPVAAYVALVFTLSAQPNLQVPFRFENSDKLAHLSEYGVLGFLVARALRAAFPDRRLAAVMTGAAIAVMAVGALDEKFQSFVPGRDSSPFDWCADALGALFAQLAFVATCRDEEV